MEQVADDLGRLGARTAGGDQAACLEDEKAKITAVVWTVGWRPAYTSQMTAVLTATRANIPHWVDVGDSAARWIPMPGDVAVPWEELVMSAQAIDVWEVITGR